ncbi:restriction endonuclease subunit S [Dokdonella fugitiva]|uniref:restriction endonuclease subunit S n=1 Tax=Dokdonella fugitiva TaxID=328517 RepID=UPI0015F8C3BD|nr:restriction endonuclease subunit S [Dokdonella fugitiva]MBA8885793.1 type I restriction enzyme S subunit [Dokdonella fugitiva]
MSDKNNKTLKPGWRRVKFGDVVRVSKGRSQDPLADGIERYVGLEHLQPGDLRIRSWGNVADGVTFTSMFQPGQVLFGKRRAYQRKVAVADFSGVCSGDIYVLETKDSKVLVSELLPFICQTDAFFDHAVGTSAGSLSPRTNWTSLAAFEFALPPKNEQSAILEVLTAAQECTTAYEAAKRAHEQILSSFIQESFSRFDKEFEHLPCKDLMDKITVGIVVKPADLYVPAGKGVRALRSLNVLPGKFALDEVVEISVEGHAQHQKSALRTGDIAIVRTGRPGDAAVVTPDLADTNCIDLIVARPGGSTSADYVVAFLNSQFGRRIFSSGTTGTAQQHFNVGEFSKLKLPVPPLAVQLEFVSRLSALRTPIQAIEKRLQDARFTMATVLSTSMFGT